MKINATLGTGGATVVTQLASDIQPLSFSLTAPTQLTEIEFSDVWDDRIAQKGPIRGYNQLTDEVIFPTGACVLFSASGGYKSLGIRAIMECGEVRSLKNRRHIRRSLYPNGVQADFINSYEHELPQMASERQLIEEILMFVTGYTKASLLCIDGFRVQAFMSGMGGAGVQGLNQTLLPNLQVLGGLAAQLDRTLLFTLNTQMAGLQHLEAFGEALQSTVSTVIRPTGDGVFNVTTKAIFAPTDFYTPYSIDLRAQVGEILSRKHGPTLASLRGCPDGNCNIVGAAPDDNVVTIQATDDTSRFCDPVLGTTGSQVERYTWPISQLRAVNGSPEDQFADKFKNLNTLNFGNGGK